LAISREDRIAGCLLGGALGDSIGSCFEGMAACDNVSIPANLRVTDDTQMTIATCEAVIESRAITPQSIADQFLRWFRNRRLTGIGASTLKALAELDVGGHWALVGATGERAAGNGAAMRIAPLAFFLDPNVDSQRPNSWRVRLPRNDEFLQAINLECKFKPKLKFKAQI